MSNRAIQRLNYFYDLNWSNKLISDQFSLFKDLKSNKGLALDNFFGKNTKQVVTFYCLKRAYALIGIQSYKTLILFNVIWQW